MCSVLRVYHSWDFSAEESQSQKHTTGSRLCHWVTKVHWPASAPAPRWFMCGSHSHQDHAPRVWDSGGTTSALLEKPLVLTHLFSAVLPANGLEPWKLQHQSEASNPGRGRLLLCASLEASEHCGLNRDDPSGYTWELCGPFTSLDAISQIWHLLAGAAVDLRAGHGGWMFSVVHIMQTGCISVLRNICLSEFSTWFCKKDSNPFLWNFFHSYGEKYLWKIFFFLWSG